LERGLRLAHCFAGDWVAQIWGDFGEWVQDEAAGG
jgi:hypothetical protein